MARRVAATPFAQFEPLTVPPSVAAARPGPAPAEGSGAVLGPALRRVVGCGAKVLFRLTAMEREACDRDAFGRRWEGAPLPIGVAPDKVARWDADVARDAAPPPDPFVLCDGPGSNFGVACPNHQISKPDFAGRP